MLCKFVNLQTESKSQMANQGQEPVEPIAPPSPPVIVEILQWNRNDPTITNNLNYVRMSDGTRKAQCKHCSFLMNPVSKCALRAHLFKYCSAQERLNV